MNRHSGTAYLAGSLSLAMAGFSSSARAQVDLRSISFASSPPTAVVGVATNYVLSIGGSVAGASVTVIFVPAVAFNAGSACTANPPSPGPGDPSTTLICSVASSPMTIQVTPQTVGTLKVVAGVIGADFDGNMANNSATATTAISTAAPVISGVTPSSGPTTGGFAVALAGYNFIGATSLKFAGIPATAFTVVSANRIDATAPAGVAGPATVAATTSQGTGSFSAFSYLASAKFYGLPPCRVTDTRNAPGPYGGPALSGGIARSFTITGQCGVPAGAKAVVLNLTAANPSSPGTIVAYPTGMPVPLAGTVSYTNAQTIAALETVLVDANGSLSFYPYQAAGTTVNLILDLSGYYK